MKVAIMQPYFFPYGGYFQLMKSVDKFIFLDDVQYVRRGWINRNKISDPSKKSQINLTVPVKKSTQNTLILNMKICDGWVEKHLKTFKHVYGKTVISHSLYKFYSSFNDFDSLNELLIASLTWTANYLKIKNDFMTSSEINCDGRGQDKIINLCKAVNGTEYCNLPGGINLYNSDFFEKNGLKLNFIDTSYHERISILETIFHENISSLRF